MSSVSTPVLFKQIEILDIYLLSSSPSFIVIHHSSSFMSSIHIHFSSKCRNVFACGDRCLSQLLTGCSGPPSHAELRSALHGLVGTDDMAALLEHIIAALDGERPPSARGALHNLCMSPDSALRCLG